MGPATILLVFGARFILRIYGGSYIAHTVVLFQLLALSLLPFCVETIAFSLDRIAGKPVRATLSQLAIAVLTLGGSWLLFGRLGLNGVGVAILVADTAVALVRLPTVLAALRRRPGATARPASATKQAAVSGSRAPARSRPSVQSRRLRGPSPGQQGRARTHPSGPAAGTRNGPAAANPQQEPATGRQQEPATSRPQEPAAARQQHPRSRPRSRRPAPKPSRTGSPIAGIRTRGRHRATGTGSRDPSTGRQ